MSDQEIREGITNQLIADNQILTRERDDWHKVADDRSAELNRVMLERDELKAKVASAHDSSTRAWERVEQVEAQLMKQRDGALDRIAELEKGRSLIMDRLCELETVLRWYGSPLRVEKDYLTDKGDRARAVMERKE